MEYYADFVEGCKACGIPIEELTPQEALRLEPLLNPELKAAVRVPDATMDAMRMPLRFFATAKHGRRDAATTTWRCSTSWSTAAPSRARRSATT